MDKLNLSPSTDHNVNLLLSDSESILSRELFRALRSKGFSVVESLKTIHVHNGYTEFKQVKSNRFIQ